MSAGIYNTTIEAGRNLVRRIRWTTLEGVAIPLDGYTRVIYNVQTKSDPVIEVVTADSDDNPTWIFIEEPPSDGYIRIAIPGSSLGYVGSPSNLYEHELILIDSSGGPTPLFRGEVFLKSPIAIFT